MTRLWHGKILGAGGAFLAAAAVIAALLCRPACSEIRVKNEATGKEQSCASSVIAGIAQVSVSDVCEAAGFTWKWDFGSQKLSCVKKNARLTLVQGMPFYLVNDTLRQMACGPVREGGMLFLPPALCREMLAATLKDSIAWREEDSLLVIAPRAAAAKAAAAAPDTAARRPADTVSQIKQPRQEVVKTVVLDPGHGGMDPGAIGPGGVEEKKVTLDIALALRDLIKKKTKLAVYCTRETDRFIPLVNRTKFANEKKADIFVSIHANSIEGDKKKKDGTRGYKVYFLSQAKNEEDKLVAMRENAVIKLEDNSRTYDNLQDILIDMAGNEYLRESQDLSIMITETFTSSLKDIPRLHLGVGQANFWVLNGTYMPSVLIEVGFISNTQEEKNLADAAEQKSIAAAVFAAIMSFKKKYEEGQ
ncbi:MAG TPA: N-acetylmuramoyl-L-alanine amidase [Chitinivibrionales bacterium]|nr:N-acetylmuramoyl-L-alanine amidase [Chitinivibrionales bacterium]